MNHYHGWDNICVLRNWILSRCIFSCRLSPDRRTQAGVKSRRANMIRLKSWPVGRLPRSTLELTKNRPPASLHLQLEPSSRVNQRSDPSRRSIKSGCLTKSNVDGFGESHVSWQKQLGAAGFDVQFHMQRAQGQLLLRCSQTLSWRSE